MSNLTNVASQSQLVVQFAIPGTTLEIMENSTTICSGAIDTLIANDKLLSVSLVNGIYTLRINRNPLELDIGDSSFDLVVTLHSAFYPNVSRIVEIASSGTHISFLSLIHNSNLINDYKFYLVKYNCTNVFNWDYVQNADENLCDAFNTFLKTTPITMQVKEKSVIYTSPSNTINTLPDILDTITLEEHITGLWSNPEEIYTSDGDQIKFGLIESSFADAEKDLTEFLSFSKDKTIANALYITNNDIINVKNVHLVPVFRVTYGGKMKSMIVETQQLLYQSDTINDKFDNISDYSISGYNSMKIEDHDKFMYPLSGVGVNKIYNKKRGNFKWKSGN
jgi:hypothetical protein